MKHNRSMKELQLDKHLFSQKQDNPEIQPFKSPTSLKPIMIDTKPHLKTSKSSKSQKQLFFPNAQFITTNKYIPTKNLHKHNHSILTPSNKNVLYPQQPKRPRILSKVRHSNSFSDEFKIGKVLGKGRFGNVQMASHNLTGSLYAVKQISLEKVSQKLIERLIAEIKIQFFLRHENCLQLYKFYKEKNTLFLVLELGECSLFDMLRQKKCFTQRQTAYYIRQTINALIYLHENNIIHRDLKPQNIVLSNNTVKLADFGWSIYMGKTKRKTFCGTLDYICPEIVMGSEYDEMVDVWSIGVLCYELCTGHAPFQSSKSRQQTYHKILNIDLKFPKFLTSDVQSFIKKLLVRKPQERMSLKDCLEHPWLKKYQ